MTSPWSRRLGGQAADHEPGPAPARLGCHRRATWPASGPGRRRVTTRRRLPSAVLAKGGHGGSTRAHVPSRWTRRRRRPPRHRLDPRQRAPHRRLDLRGGAGPGTMTSMAAAASFAVVLAEGVRRPDGRGTAAGPARRAGRRTRRAGQPGRAGRRCYAGHRQGRRMIVVATADQRRAPRRTVATPPGQRPRVDPGPPSDARVAGRTTTAPRRAIAHDRDAGVGERPEEVRAGSTRIAASGHRDRQPRQDDRPAGRGDGPLHSPRRIVTVVVPRGTGTDHEQRVVDAQAEAEAGDRLTAKIETSVTREVANSTKKLPRMAPIPTRSGMPAATRLPKTTISRIRVTGIAMDSDRERSRATCSLMALATACPPPT